MMRLLAAAAVAVAALFALPMVAVLAFTAVTPAVLAAVLAGDTDQTDPLPVPSRAVPTSPSRTSPPRGQSAAILAWAAEHVGQPYRMGAAGPSAWDCSSFTQAAYAHVGVTLPRTAQQQRDWLAAGHGTRITPGTEQPGDLIFWDSYLGPAAIGHVVLVDDPSRHRTVEAHNTRAGTGYFTYHPHHQLYEIWRPSPPATRQPTERRR